MFNLDPYLFLFWSFLVHVLSNILFSLREIRSLKIEHQLLEVYTTHDNSFWVIVLICVKNIQHVSSFIPLLYPRSPNLCPEAMVDCVGNLGYSFKLHDWLPLRVAMSQHCVEPRCSFQTLEGRSLIGYYVTLFNVLISRFS